jgi:hypothetical protein
LPLEDGKVDITPEGGLDIPGSELDDADENIVKKMKKIMVIALAAITITIWKKTMAKNISRHYFPNFFFNILKASFILSFEVATDLGLL